MKTFSKLFLLLIAVSNLNLYAVRGNSFERFVARHPYWSTLAAASVGAVISLYAYKKFVQQSNLKKDDEVKKEAKSLFSSAASLVSHYPIASIAVAGVALGTGTAAAIYGMPVSAPVCNPHVVNLRRNTAA